MRLHVWVGALVAAGSCGCGTGENVQQKPPTGEVMADAIQQHTILSKGMAYEDAIRMLKESGARLDGDAMGLKIRGVDGLVHHDTLWMLVDGTIIKNMDVGLTGKGYSGKLMWHEQSRTVDSLDLKEHRALQGSLNLPPLPRSYKIRTVVKQRYMLGDEKSKGSVTGSVKPRRGLGAFRTEK